MIREAMDVIHTIIMAFICFGGFVFPVRYLPAHIIACLIFLGRYHEYCYVTEATTLIDEIIRGCRLPEDEGFSERVLDFYKNTLGFHLTPEFISTTTTSMALLAAVVSVCRLCLHFRIPLVPDTPCWIFAWYTIGLWALFEFYSSFVMEKIESCEKREV